jgi:chondroitin 4-sulfotransferase 11
MPVNRDKKIVFVHIPKCAGTSVNEFMDIIFPSSRKSGTRCPRIRGDSVHVLYGGTILEHLTASEIRDTLGPEEYDDMESFTVIRNPWDRMVSFYVYIKSLVGEKWLQNFSFEDFVHLVQEHSYFGPFRSQCHYIFDDTGKKLVNHIFRFEELRPGLVEFLAARMNKSPNEFPRANSTDRNAYPEYYNDETKQIVDEIYKRDIETFGYQFEGRSLSSDVTEKKQKDSSSLHLSGGRRFLAYLIFYGYTSCRECAVTFLKSRDKICFWFLWTLWILVFLVVIMMVVWAILFLGQPRMSLFPPKTPLPISTSRRNSFLRLQII